MAISTNHGPLIESSTTDGAVYQLRGDSNPILYVYPKVGGRYAEKRSSPPRPAPQRAHLP